MSSSFASAGSIGGPTDPLGGLGTLTGLGGLINGGNSIPNGYPDWLTYFKDGGLQGLPYQGQGLSGNSLNTGTPISNPTTDPTLTSDTGNTTNSIPSTGNISDLLKIILGSGGAAASTSVLQQIIGGLTGKTGVPSGLVGQLSSLLGQVGLPVYGAINAQNQQQWNNAAKISTLNYLQQQGANAQTSANSAQAGYLPAMLSQLMTSQGLTNSLQSQQASDIGGALSSAPGAFNGVTDLSRVPGTQDLINTLNGLQGTGSSALGSLQSNLTGGPLASGLQTATGLASSQNPYAQQLQQIASGLVNGQSVAQPNAATSQAQNVASSILGQNPLLSMDQVKSMAVDQNARNSINSENTLRRQLLDRTGVTGPAIAGGSQNELLGSLQDQGLQNQASGLTQAMLGQQGLQSQLFNTGASLFGAGQNAQNATGQLNLQQLLGGAGLLSGSQGLNISALNALSSLAGTQNQGYGTLGSLLSTLSGTALGQQNALQGVQNFGLSSQNDLYNQLNSLLGAQGNLSGQTQTGELSAAQFPQNTYNQNLNFLQSLAGNNTGLFGGNVAPQNFFSGITT